MRKWSIKTLIPHYYPDKKLPELPAEEISSLLVLAKQGDLDARNKLIEGKLRQALSIAATIAFTFPLKADDLAELAPFYLVKCIDSFIRNGKDDGLDKYVTTYMFYTLRHALFEDKIIRIPKTSARRHNQKGTFDSLNVSVQTHGVINHEVIELLVTKLSSKGLTVNMDPDLDLRETINSVLSDDEERRILELKIIGCSDSETAAETGRSVSYVAKKRAEILHKIKMELLK